MSISSEITLLNNTKQAIKNSINQKGGSITDSTPFADYSTAIDNLPSGGSGNPVLESIDVSDFTGTTFNDAKKYITSAVVPNGVTRIGAYAFSYFGITSISLPNTLTTLDTGVFSSCFSLTSVTIPNSVTTIGHGCFENCSSITSLTIPNTITQIEYETFKGCTSLTSFTIPSGVTSIGYGVFRDCRSFTSVTIPSNVVSIGYDAFKDCIGLNYVISFPTTPPTLGSNAFGNTNNCPIYVPAESVAAYKAATNWSTYESRIFAIAQVATVDGNPVYNYDLGNKDATTILSTEIVKMPTGTNLELAEGIVDAGGSFGNYTRITLPSTFTSFDDQDMIGSTTTTLVCKATTPPTAERDRIGGSNLTAIYVPEASVTDYQADAAWVQFSAITYPLYEVATVDGKSVYNADLGETGQVTTMTSAMLAALPTGTSVKFSDDIDTFSGQIGAYEQVTLPASGSTQLEFTVASPINAATETLVVPFDVTNGPDIVVANDTLGGAGLTEIIIETDVCGMEYRTALGGLMNTAGFTSFADIIKAKPEDFMVITNLDVEPNPDGVFTMSLAHAEQDTESSDPDALICYAPFTICKPSFATDQATSDGTFVNQRGQQRTYFPMLTGVNLYNGDTLVDSDVYVEVDNKGIGAGWNSANDVWSIIFYTDLTGAGTDIITLQPGMRFEGFIDNIQYDYDSETSCQGVNTQIAHSYFTINVTA